VAVSVGKQRTIYPGSSTNAKRIRADVFLVAYDTEVPTPNRLEACVFQWGKRLVEELLLSGDVNTAGFAKT